MKKILIIVTFHEALINKDSTTGLWIGEFTDPYYEFIFQGYQITIASPKGSKPPIDPLSELTENLTKSNKRFQDDQSAKSKLNNTLKLEDISGEDYDALFYSGSHGLMFNMAANAISGELIIEFLKHHKPVAAVCHRPAALLKAG